MELKHDVIYDVPKHPKFALGDVVSYKPDGFRFETQGLILSMWSTDENGENVVLQLMVLQRPPTDMRHDIFKNGFNILEYYQTNDIVDTPAENVICIVPNVQTEPDITQDFFRTEFAVNRLKKGLMYITKYEDDETQDIYESVPTKIVLQWHHFDPAVTSHTVFGDYQDSVIAFWLNVKVHLFDPFVSALSRSARRETRNKNRNLWEFLLHNCQEPIEWVLAELKKHPLIINHPKKAVDPDFSLLDVENMYVPEVTIDYILKYLRTFHPKPEVSAPRMMYSLRRWYRDVEKLLEKISQGLSVSTDKAGKDDDVDEKDEVGSLAEFVEADKSTVDGDDEVMTVDEKTLDSGDDTNSDYDSSESGEKPMKIVKRVKTEDDSEDDDESDPEVVPDSDDDSY